MYTDKTANGTQLRLDSARPPVKVVNKPMHAEIVPDAVNNDAEAEMCLGSRDV